jgi:UMF1 family MFS transporter
MASVLACVGFAGGLVFYNSYLPEIVTEDKMDSLSAKGFSLGYIGSVLLLIVNLVMIQMPDVFGFSGAGQASRVSFLLVGFWWMGFAQITFAYLPKGTAKPLAEGQKLIKMGILELIKVQKSFQHLPSLTRYLVAFFLYSTGVQTVMLLAPTFAKGEIKVSDAGLIIVVLLIQIVAIFGALLFSSISNKKGNKFAISIMLGIWVVICILAYLVQTEQQFYGLAVLVGLVMGGIQSISRSTYSKLIPENSKDTTSYFSFYDVTEKSSIVLGTFLFGFIEQISGTMRNSTLVLTVFFVLGFIALQRIEKIGKSKEA